MEKTTNRLPHGLWPVMLTTFNSDKSIDFKGLECLTDFYISNGSSGLFANCLSSEMFQLSEEERLQVTRAVVCFSNDKVPVISTGSFYKDSNKNIEFIKKISDQGVDTVVLISSILIDQDEQEDVLKRKIEKIMGETGNIRLGMYECPSPYKRCITPETIKWLADTGRFIFHKDTTCKEKAIKEKIDIVNGTSLQIYNAHTPDALKSLHDGADGLCPISANFFPELYAKFFQLFYSGELEKLKKLNRKMIEMDYIIHQQFYPWSAKVFLKRRGLKILTNSRICSNGRIKNHENLEVLFRKTQKVFSEFEIKGIGMQ